MNYCTKLHEHQDSAAVALDFRFHSFNKPGSRTMISATKHTNQEPQLNLKSLQVYQKAYKNVSCIRGREFDGKL